MPGRDRLIVVARPTIKGEMHGLLTTLQSGKGAHLSPVATPIVLKLLKAGERLPSAASGRGTRRMPSMPDC